LGTHAFFKALLFLGAGSVIHAMSDEQDITKMGGLKRLIPKTYAFMWIGTLALIGMPFFAGFYSKDAILESLYHTHHYTAYALGLIVVSLTSFYSLRLMILTFHGKPKANDHVMAHVHESPNSMLGPLVILAFGALFSGYFGERIFVEMSHFDWKGALIILPAPHEHPSFIIGLLPLIFMTAGIVGAYFVYGSKSPYTFKGGAQIHRFLAHKWWIDEVYERFICNPALRFGKFLWQVCDVKVIDTFGPNGMARLAVFVSSQNRRVQTGYVYHYALLMIVGLLAFSALLYLSLTK
jgi:NADH-quinone oxidoreductase subunit L